MSRVAWGDGIRDRSIGTGENYSLQAQIICAPVEE